MSPLARAMAEEPQSVAPWPAELFLLSATSRAELQKQAASLAQSLTPSESVDLAPLACTLADQWNPGEARLAIIAPSLPELRQRLEVAVTRLADPKTRHIRDMHGIYYRDEPLARTGKLAFLFPGEGAQYLNMLGDLRDHFPAVARFVQECEAGTLARREGASLARFLVVPPDKDSEDTRRALEDLRQLGNAMLSVLVADWALYELLTSFDVRPDAVAGHSMGELAALRAAGSWHADESFVNDLFATLDALERDEKSEDGSEAILLAVAASRTALAAILDELAVQDAFVAMENCPHQTVVVGRPESMTAVEKAIQSRQWMYERLPLRRPYHTPLFESRLGPLEELLCRARFLQPNVPVYSCTTGNRFPTDPDSIQRLTVRHWAAPVEFTRMIESMHADGVRLFVEVGPRGNLSAFVEDILRGREFAAIPANVPRRTPLTQFLHLLGQLAAHHVPFDPRVLFTGRMASPRSGAAPAAPSGSALRLSAKPAAGAPARVMHQYLEVMDEFLSVQEQVTRAFFARRPRGSLNGRVRFSQPAAPVLEEPFAGRARPPLVGEIVEFQPGERMIMRRRLIEEDDLFASDHTVGGRSISRVEPAQHGFPVLPMTFGLEMMAEAAAALAPGMVPVAIEDVRLFRWLPYDAEHPHRIEVRAQRQSGSDSDSATTFEVEIRDLSETGTRKSVADPGAVVVSAIARLAKSYPTGEPAGPWHLTNERPCSITLERLYENLFHGALFQGVIGMPRIGDEGIESEMVVGERSGLLRAVDEPAFLLDPVLLDVAMHATAAWHLEQPNQAGRVMLPVELKRVSAYGPPPPVGTKLTARAVLVDSTARTFRHSVDVFGPDERLLYQLDSVRYWRFYVPFGQINFHGPKDEYFLSQDEPGAWPAEHAGTARAQLIRLEPPADLTQPAMRLVTGKMTLSQREWVELRNLNGPERDEIDWLFGRAAAKDAIRILYWRRHGYRLYPADIEMEWDLSGIGQAWARLDAHGQPDPKTQGKEWPAAVFARAGSTYYAFAAFDHRIALVALLRSDLPQHSKEDAGFLEAVGADRGEWDGRMAAARVLADRWFKEPSRAETIDTTASLFRFRSADGRRMAIWTWIDRKAVVAAGMEETP